MDQPAPPLRKSGPLTRMLALAAVAAAALGLAWYLNVGYLAQQNAQDLRGQDVRAFESEKAEFEVREGSSSKEKPSSDIEALKF